MADVSAFRNRASALVAFALVAAAALGVKTAGAAEWWYVNQGQDRVMLVDVASITRERGLLSYWNTQVIADGAEDGVRMTKSLSLIHI